MTNTLLTTTEAAERLGCSASTVRRLLDTGILRGYVLPGSKHRRVSIAEVDRLAPPRQWGDGWNEQPTTKEA